MIRYKLVKKLGPTNRPNQNTTLPRTVLPFSSLLLDTATSGICSNCIQNKYPLTFLNITAMHISCTSAESKNVTKVAAFLLRWKLEMDE